MPRTAARMPGRSKNYNLKHNNYFEESGNNEDTQKSEEEIYEEVHSYL